MISAGEASGDVLGAGLVEAIRSLEAHEFIGLVGPHMEAQKVSAIAHTEELGVMGIVEVLGSLPRIRKVLKRMEDALDGVDLLVAIDSPDFNLRLAEKATKRGIPVVLLGSPQVWAWRSGRAKVIAEGVQEVICLFPFEPEYYTEHGGTAICIGHPSAAALNPLKREGDGLALVPGSRKQELTRLLPTMIRVASAWRESRPQASVTLARAPGLPEHCFEPVPDWIEMRPTLSEALAPASVVLACSGTASLEIACLDRPQVVLYRMNPLTYVLAKPFLKKGQQIALPNLLADAQVSEFLQTLPEKQILEALVDAETSAQQESGRVAVRNAVTGGGFTEAAERCLFWLRKAQTG